MRAVEKCVEKVVVQKAGKLAKVMQSALPTLKYNDALKLLRQKDVKVNGVRVKENVDVVAGDVLEIYAPQSMLTKPLPALEIVFENKDVCVVNKPKGVEVEGAYSLTDAVRQVHAQAVAVHRLDRNTKGLVIFAKNETAEKELMQAFANHTIEKHYVALCENPFSKKHEVCKAFWFKDEKAGRVFINSKPKKGWVPITTEYTVVQKFGTQTMVEIILHTGKTHQIRAHMAYLGHPLVGDGKYGKGKKNETQALLAYKLVFTFAKTSPLAYMNGATVELEDISFA